MLKMKLKIKASCPRHRGYNPEKDGEGGIKGNCAGCLAILGVFRQSEKLSNHAKAVQLLLDASRRTAAAP
jgi:hypothetical protein